jgi:glycerol kinase
MRILRVDGGATNNNELMQIQSNYSNLPVDRPTIVETTAFGSGLFAGLGVGLFDGLDDIYDLRVEDRVFQPQSQAEKTRDEHLQGWQRAVAATEAFAGKS